MLWFPSRERATVMGINQTTVNAGGIIGAGMLPTVALSLGWEYGYLLMGIAALVVFLLTAFFYRAPPPEVTPLTGNNKVNDVPSPQSVRQATQALYKSRDIWMLGISCLFLAGVEFAALSHLVLYLTDSLFFNVVAASVLLAVAVAAGGFAKPLTGIISDRIMGGRRKVILLFMGMLTAAMCALLSFTGPDIGWLLYPLLVVLGIGAIGWGGIYVTMAGELGGKQAAGAAYSIASVVMLSGSMVGPPVFGLIVDTTGSYQTAWLAMALAGVMSVLFITMIRERRP